MRAGRLMALAAALLLAGAGGSCGGGGQNPKTDGGQDRPPDGAMIDYANCLERPDELERPPTGQLPCELIPPGLRL